MDILQITGYLSGIIGGICFIPYIRDIALKKSVPERASWIIWATLGSIAFFSQLSKGAGDSLWMTGAQTTGVFITLFLSIKFGVGGLKRRDVISLIVAAFGLVLWYFTKEPLFALVITIMIDSIGFFLSIVKTYKDPSSETLTFWVMASIAGILAAISVGKMDFALLAYPLYICFGDFLMSMAIILGKRKATLV